MSQGKREWLLLVLALSACAAPPEPGDPVEGEDIESTASPAAANDTPAKVDGYTVIKSKLPDGREAAVKMQAPPGMQVIRQPEPDPHGGNFPLTEAVAGLPKKGRLTATIHTSMGVLTCDLYEDKTPNTVANFVGLARGLRKYWDTRQNAWVGSNYFDGTTFHRVIPTFMIQGGDYMGDGSGFTGYMIPDELHPTLKHDRGGQLCMANRGPNTNSAQFFITEAAAPHLDNSYTIFGQCEPLDVVFRIARVPQGPANRPITPVTMERVEISRRTGPAVAATAPTPVGGMPPIPPNVHIANKIGEAQHVTPTKQP